MKNYLIELDGNQNLTRDYIGNKAYHVNLLKSLKQNIPKSYVLSPDFFIDLIGLEVFQLSKDSTNFGNLLQKELIKSKNNLLWKNLVNELMEIYSRDDTLAIRSTSLDEDGEYSAGAGNYATVLDVKLNYSDILNAIMKVFESYIKNKFVWSENEGITFPILLQEHINLEYNGVAFSRNPLTMEKEFVLEVGTPQKSVVNGEIEYVSIYSKSKEGVEEQNNDTSRMNNASVEVSYKYGSKIKELIYNLENLAGFSESGIDLEWGIDHLGEIYIFQIRAITTRPLFIERAQKEGHFFVDLDDDEVHLMGFPKFYKGLIAKQWKKRHWMKQILREAGIDSYYKLGFYVFEKENVQKKALQNEIDALFSCENLLLIFESENGRINKVINRDEFHDSLKTLKTVSGVCVVWVTEFHKPILSGYSKIVDDKVIIEYIFGDLIGLKNEVINYVSEVEFTLSGDKVSERISLQPVQYSFDADNHSIRTNYDGIVPEISKQNLSQILKMTTILNSTFNGVVVEWVQTNRGLLAYDMSEDTSISDHYKTIEGYRVISSGVLIGNIIELSDGEFRKLVEFNNTLVSVVPSLKELENVESNAIIDKIMKKFPEVPNPIVFAPYPDISLLPIINKVSGFIFKSGSTLGHLAIHLRENRIPAIILDDEELIENSINMVI